MKFLPRHFTIRLTLRLRFMACPWICVALLASNTSAQETIDVGKTGFSEKKPVLASACPHGCPWGELGDYVKEAMAPLGYEVILCRNCNRDQGPRIVAKASLPPELSAQDTFVGTTTRVNAPVDFGITESGFLAQAYAGKFSYAADGPFQNLRLIAKIEDPTYLLAAVKADSPITDPQAICRAEAAGEDPGRKHADLTAGAGVLRAHGGSSRSVGRLVHESDRRGRRRRQHAGLRSDLERAREPCE